ncbi:hypothetical protein WS83_07300 [Burkholderia sp. MSMB2042]|nr:hypothetical protein WS77_21210 [Burkholderia sp. MSMB0265]KVG94319.1 hypothetical protein WS83_07300 [Burkholderia sp. MSMB2042]
MRVRLRAGRPLRMGPTRANNGAAQALADQWIDNIVAIRDGRRRNAGHRKNSRVSHRRAYINGDQRRT